jgi:hypothetical protein
MWVTVHTISGMAVGAGVRAVLPEASKSARPAPGRARGHADGRAGVRADMIAALGGLTSHALFDAFPHWDYTNHRLRPLWATIDVTIAVATVLAARRAGFGRAVLLAGAMAALPDADVLDAVLPGHSDIGGRQRRRVFPSHWPVYPHGRASMLVGTLVQVGIVTASGAVLAGTQARAQKTTH